MHQEFADYFCLFLDCSFWLIVAWNVVFARMDLLLRRCQTNFVTCFSDFWTHHSLWFFMPVWLIVICGGDGVVGGFGFRFREVSFVDGGFAEPPCDEVVTRRVWLSDMFFGDLCRGCIAWSKPLLSPVPSVSKSEEPSSELEFFPPVWTFVTSSTASTSYKTLETILVPSNIVLLLMIACQGQLPAGSTKYRRWFLVFWLDDLCCLVASDSSFYHLPCRRNFHLSSGSLPSAHIAFHVMNLFLFRRGFWLMGRNSIRSLASRMQESSVKSNAAWRRCATLTPRTFPPS